MTDQAPEPLWHVHDSRDDLFTALTEIVARELSEALAARGTATLAVSGGNTPAPFHRLLSACDLDWSKIVITLTDERLVSEDSDRSNARMVRETLLREKASHAVFIPLWRPDMLPEAMIPQVAGELDQHLPVDVCIAGLGEDCHTASLFPGAPELEQALMPGSDEILALMTPPDGLEPRITLTGPVLRQSRHRHLLMAGTAKRAAFARAEAVTSLSEAPVRVLMTGRTPLHIHYAP
ncbi:MAG: 6-phosphogluconolactonase [Rhodospirillales bacterium]